MEKNAEPYITHIYSHLIYGNPSLQFSGARMVFSRNDAGTVRYTPGEKLNLDSATLTKINPVRIIYLM